MADPEFLIFVHNTLRMRFPQAQGWRILRQPKLPSGSRHDFLVNRSETIIFVVDAKDEERLERSEIEYLSDCIVELKTQGGMIYTSSETQIPDSIADYANVKGIEITRTQWWQDS